MTGRGRAALPVLLLVAVTTGCRLFSIRPLEVVDWSPREERVDITEVDEIRVRFSADVNAALAEEAFSLAEAGAPVAGSFHWSSGDTFTFRPSIELKECRIYTIRIDTSAEDLRGNSLAEDFVHRFGSRGEIDRPRIVQISPPDHARIDDLSAAIVVTFSEAMDPTAVQEGFSMSPSVEGYTTWDPGALVFTFHPTEEYTWQTAYALTLDSSVADASGNTLAETARHHFYTGSESDPPLLLSARSGSGALSVVPDDDEASLLFTDGWEKDMALVLTFSEAMEPSSVTSALSWSPELSYEVAWGSADTTLTIMPAEYLAWNTVYSLSIAASLRDLHGNGLQVEGPLRLRVSGAGSRPPEIVKVSFLEKLSPDSTRQLHSFEPLIFDPGYAAPGAEYLKQGNSFLDLHFRLAAGAEIDYFSLLDAFSISCRNASVTPLGLQLDAEATYSVNNSVPPGLPYGEPDHHVARIVLGVDNSGGYDSAPGLLAIRVDADFQDTMGNALGSPWQMTVVTTN